MNPGDPQIVERMAWEGVVGAPAALAILLVLAVWTGWSLWRERFAVGRGWAAVFWVLRMVAFGCALWMLAGPTQLRIERTTQPQSIAIFADGSESMDVVDAPDPGDSIRWAMAVSGDDEGAPLGTCDRLLVDLGAAHAECLDLDRMVKEHRPLKQLKAACDSVTVLEPASGSSGLLWAPGSGARATSGSYSPALLTLNGIAAAPRSMARSFSPASVAMRLCSASVGSAGWGRWERPVGCFGALAMADYFFISRTMPATSMMPPAIGGIGRRSLSSVCT